MQILRKGPLAGAIGAALALNSLAACGAGGSGDAVGIKNKTVEVGISGIMSGPIAESRNVNYGLISYLKYINSKGGVNGYKFSWTEKDNANNSTQAAAVARQFAPTSFVQFAGGTQAVIGVKPLADKLKMPIVATGSGDYFTPDPSKYMYGMTPPYSMLVNHDANFLIEDLGLKDIGFAVQAGLPGADTIPGYVESLGAQLDQNLTVDPATTDFTSYAKKLKDSGAKGVVTLMSGTVLAGLQKASAAIGYNPKWIGMFLLADPSYKELAGDLATGTYFDAYTVQADGTDPAATLYRDAVTKYYPKAVESNSTVQGWNVGALIVKGVEDATDGDKTLTRAEFLDALSALKDTPVGMVSSVTYDDTQHYGSSASGVFEYTADGTKQVRDFEPLTSFASK